MPRASQSTNVDMSNYKRAIDEPRIPVQPPIAPPTSFARSPIMISSLPGLSTGPDAILRQFHGGRTAPWGRIYVP